MARETVPVIIGVPVPAPRHFRVPWKAIVFAAIAFIALAGIYRADWIVSRVGENTSAPTAPIILEPLEPVAQPVQPAPVVVPPAIPTLRIRAEGPWVEIGTARNGNEVLALPIPWDRLVMLPVTPDNKAMWFEIAKLDPPPAANIPNVNPVQGWSGYVQEGNKLILYGVSNYRWSERDPQVLSYWRREATIEGLSP